MADQPDDEHEQPINLATLPLELLVRVCFAVGSATWASLRMVATAFAGAVRDVVHINTVATERMHVMLRGWTMRLRIMDHNGACSCCGQRHLGAFSQVCSFCYTPFCSRACMHAHWHVHRSTCGWREARLALRAIVAHVPRDAREVIRLLRLHDLHHLLPPYLRPTVLDLEGEGTAVQLDNVEEVD